MLWQMLMNYLHIFQLQSFYFFLLCSQSHKKAGLMWLEAGLGWKDFLPEDEDVNKFVTEQVLKAVLYCIDGQHNF